MDTRFSFISTFSPPAVVSKCAIRSNTINNLVYCLNSSLRGKHKGLIFHSDRGSQYSSKKYKAMLEKTALSVQ